MPDSFATAGQAASYGYELPPDAADGLLARASQAIRDAAGFGVLSEDITLEAAAERGFVPLPVPLVTAVSSVTPDGGTPLAAGDWRWQREPRRVAGDRIRLGRAVKDHWHGRFAVSLTHGLASAPDSLVLLASAVAYRLAGMPAALAAGITSQSVGQVSWSAPGSRRLPSAGLTDGECSQLARIVPLRRAWQVRL